MEKHENPWTVLQTESPYENDWIQVQHHEVLDPSGGLGIYGTVLFKNKALGIIPIDEEGNTWLVGQYRFPLDEYSWEIPMGGGKIGIDVLESAKRELLEETGLVAEKWTLIQRIHTSNAVTDEEGFTYIAEHLRQEEAQPEPTEQLTIKKMPLKEAVQMALDGRITDGISLAGLLKVAILRKIIF